MSLGEKIKTAREAAGITQEELGRLCGTTKQTIYKYETGIITNIPFDRLEKIADVVGVPATQLLGWKEVGTSDLINGDPELTAYLDSLRTRPEMRMLFSVANDCTKEDVEKAVAVIEALRKTEGK